MGGHSAGSLLLSPLPPPASSPFALLELSVSSLHVLESADSGRQGQEMGGPREDAAPAPTAGGGSAGGRDIAVLPGPRRGRGASASQHLPLGLGGWRFQSQNHGGPWGPGYHSFLFALLDLLPHL